MKPAATTVRAPTRAHRWALGFVLLFAFGLRLQGINWPAYHPDEPVIARWLAHGEPDRAYAGGFFTLARPFRAMWRFLESARHRVEVFRGLTEAPVPPPPDYILMARFINLWLSVLTCLFVFHAAHVMTDSWRYSVLSAALMAFSQYHVEHSHYAETDIAMVFALAAALAAWLVFVRTERLRWFLAAGLALGFAGGTKFPIVALWPAFAIFPIIGKKPPHFSNVWKWRVFGPSLAALLLVLGFVWATPAVTDWREFWQSAAAENARVWRETALNMGPLAAHRFVRWAARLHDFGTWSFSLGAGWLVLWALSAPTLLAGNGRRYAVPLLLAPSLYLAYWIFRSPWVRTQEFVVFLPFAAVAAPWAAWLVWRRPSFTVRAVSLLACAISLAAAAARSIQTSSIFGWTDTRELASRWFALCAPSGAKFAKEKYADATAPEAQMVPIRMVARHSPEDWSNMGFDFVLRNGAEGDRGMVHPITGRRYPEFDEIYSRFLAQSELLKVFAPLPPPDTLTTFNSIRVELFGLPRYRTWPTVRHPLPQPAAIMRGARHTFFRVGRQLGPDTVLELTEDGVECAIGGPEGITAPLYAVLYTRERPAVVSLKGFGRSWRVRLEPYDARIITLLRPAWIPRLSHFEKIRARVLPQRNLYRIPCYLRIAFSRAEARRVAQEIGAVPPELAAWGSDSERGLQYIEQLEALANMPLTNFGVGPNSAWYYDRFARLRMTNDFAVEWLDEESGEPQPRSVSRAQLTFPAVRPSFAGTLEFVVRLKPAPDAKTSVNVTFFDGDGKSPLATTSLVCGAANPVTLHLAAGAPGELRLFAETEDPVIDRLEYAQFSWNIRDALTNEIVHFRLALAERRLCENKPDDAQAILSKLPPDLPPRCELRKRRMLLEIHRQRNDEKAAQDAAASLLELAPHHQAALSACAAGHPTAARAFPSTSAMASGEPIRFHRFVRLSNACLDQRSGSLRIWMQVTEDAPPPLAVRVYTRRHGRWKPGGKIALPFNRRPTPAAKGELFEVALPLPEPADLARIALAVESDVKWHAGRLAAAGFRDGIIPLSDVIRGSSPQAQDETERDRPQNR
jgi:hypothetical protein